MTPKHINTLAIQELLETLIFKLDQLVVWMYFS